MRNGAQVGVSDNFELSTIAMNMISSQKRVSDSHGTGVLLELESQRVLSRHVGAGD